MGLRNLAWCSLTLKKDSDSASETISVSSIDQWKVESCVEDEVNVNATSLDFLIAPFVAMIQSCLDGLPRLEHPISLADEKKCPWDAILIESQPMGHGRSFGGTSMGGSPRNLKTKVLSHILQSMVLLRWPDAHIQFISPTLKMRECPIAFRERTYKDNKKWAITKTQELVSLMDASMFRDGIFTGKKMDDLADCFLQGYYVARLVLAGSMKFEASEAVTKKTLKASKPKEVAARKRKAKTDDLPEAPKKKMRGKKKVEALSVEDDF